MILTLTRRGFFSMIPLAALARIIYPTPTVDGSVYTFGPEECEQAFKGCTVEWSLYRNTEDGTLYFTDGQDHFKLDSI